jgi:lipid-A-disaccharide synthase
MHLFVIAGESSADVVGESLINGMKERFPYLTYTGIGGPRMEAAGKFRSLFPFSHLSHIGITAVIKNLRSLNRCLKETIRAISETQPVGLLTIDCPEFCLRVSKRIKNIPRIHCIPPAVWAWRARRARTMHRATDYILSLFPFEAPYFSHMPYAFVGHPVWNQRLGHAHRFWQEQQTTPQLSLALLPGSRRQEITKFLPVFLKAAAHLRNYYPNLYIFIVTTETMKDLIAQMAPHYPIVVHNKSHALAAATVALSASGTVSLELALHGVPMVIGYQIGPISGWIAKKIITLPYVSLINIVAGQKIVPECLQENFKSFILAQEIKYLLDHPDARETQKKLTLHALRALQTETPFSNLCAQHIGKFLNLSFL